MNLTPETSDHIDLKKPQKKSFDLIGLQTWLLFIWLGPPIWSPKTSCAKDLF